MRISDWSSDVCSSDLEALENLSDRAQVEDFNYVVMSIGIQRETGGNLAGVLTGLAHVIRERARMFLKVRALSAEGRISALVLCVLPFGVGAMIFLGNPGYYKIGSASGRERVCRYV